MLGSDICPELVSIGRRRGHEVIISDCLNLPYKTNLFDSLICIAVIHHLSTDCRRLAAIRELVRVLRPGGTMLLYVWAMEQERKKASDTECMFVWINGSIFYIFCNCLALELHACLIIDK